jgi:metal-sulfur cluster biosynthetic enzyme
MTRRRTGRPGDGGGDARGAGRTGGTVDLAAARRAAGSVPDPEIRRTLAELDLLDTVEEVGGRVTVRYHLTSPLCPSPFAIDIGREVRRRVEELPGVERCTVVIQDHFIADEIARAVNEGPVESAPAWL